MVRARAIPCSFRTLDDPFHIVFLGGFYPLIRTRFYHFISIIVTSLLSQIKPRFPLPSSCLLSLNPLYREPGLIGQLAQHPYAQNHDEQADGDDDEQREGEPAEHHGARADAGLDAAVAKVLGDGARGDGGGVLPQDRDQHEDGGDEDDGQGHLRHGPAGEGLHLAVGPLAVLLLVPAGEGGEQEEADEGEDYCDDAVDTVSTDWLAGVARGGKKSNYSHEVGEHDRVLELARQPDEVEGVLVDRDLLGERGGVVGAQPAAAVRVDADAEVAHAGLQVGVAR